MTKLTTMILLYLLGIVIIIIVVFCPVDEPTTTRQDWMDEMRMKNLIETPPVI